jgi:hypothetical protein
MKEWKILLKAIEVGAELAITLSAIGGHFFGNSNKRGVSDRGIACVRMRAIPSCKLSRLCLSNDDCWDYSEC